MEQLCTSLCKHCFKVQYQWVPSSENRKADTAAMAARKTKGTAALLNRSGEVLCPILGAISMIARSQAAMEEEELVNVPLEVAKR